MSVHMRRLAAGLFLAVSAATPAVADDFLAAGSLFGGLNQTRMVCFVTNIGGPAITVSQAFIADQFGTRLTPVIDQCGALAGGQLASLRTCGVAVDVTGDRSYTCRTRVGPNKTFVRGSFDVRDANQNVLNSLPLQ